MTVVSKTESLGHMRQIVTVDAHTLYADVSVAAGGEATAPTAHDLFDAALAACKATTACVYARHKNIALDRVEVQVTRNDAEERQGKYVLDVKVFFEGGLSEADKERIHDVIKRCPVHKLMTSSTVEIRQERV